MAQMAAIANRSRTVNGVPTSLCDLGYCDVGLDDNWQSCGKYGPNGYSFHDANGRPVVNQQRFPDFIAMTTYAHSLGLTSGWYGNNCICSDHCSDETCYQGDVDAVMDYGFDSIKREFGGGAGRGARRRARSRAACLLAASRAATAAAIAAAELCYSCSNPRPRPCRPRQHPAPAPAPSPSAPAPPPPPLLTRRPPL